MRDITDEVLIRREKDRLEMYFKNVVDKLPGGVSVIRVEADGSMTPEFISHGFGVMTHMTVEEAAGLYKTDILAGVYPDDIPEIESKLKWYMEHNSQQGELVGRMLRGDGGYVWVRINLSMRRMPDGVQFLYCVYTDISKDMEEKAQIRRQYEELLLRHYRMPEPGTLIAGHSDITKNKMLEIRDYMNTNLLETFYNQALLEAFAQNHLEQEQECFVKLPYRKKVVTPGLKLIWWKCRIRGM